MAKSWKTVPEQISCDTPNALNEPILIGAREERPIKLDASSCGKIKFLEHVHLHIDLKTQAWIKSWNDVTLGSNPVGPPKTNHVFKFRRGEAT